MDINNSRINSKIEIIRVGAGITRDKEEFLNAILTLSGNHLIITVVEANSETSNVFKLDDITSFKIHPNETKRIIPRIKPKDL